MCVFVYLSVSTLVHRRTCLYALPFPLPPPVYLSVFFTGLCEAEREWQFGEAIERRDLSRNPLY